MTLRTNTVKISGAPSESGWSQSFEYPQDENNPANISLLVIVFSTISKNSEMEEAVLSRELLKRFREEYFSDGNKPPDGCLRDAVKKIFNEFFQKLDGLEIASVCMSENNLYAACINGGKVSLYRDRFLVKILDSKTPQLVAASGFPLEGDIMVLSTSDFYKHLTFLQIKEPLSKGVDYARDLFSMKLNSVSTMSAALIEFIKKSEHRYESGKEAEATDASSRSELQEDSHFHKKVNFFERVRRSIPGRRIFLHRDRSEVQTVKSRKTAFIGIILTMLLLVSVVFGIYKNKKDTYKSSYAQTLTSAKSSIEDAISLKGTNLPRSREELLRGKSLLNKLKEDGIKDSEIGVLEKLVSENESMILGEKHPNSEMWLDLTLIVDGFSAGQIVDSDNMIYAMDFSKNKIISIDASSKKSKTTNATDEIKNIKSFLVRANEIYFLTDNGIYKNSSKEKIIGKNWNEAEFFTFFSSNIYILDKQKGEVLKSAGTQTGFSEAKKWTTSDAEDFGSVRSFMVDGFVWILKDSGIEKFSYGNNIKFELSGYPYDLPDYDLMFTDESTADLYLLSKKSKTISVFDKDGVYKNDLIADAVSDAKDFFVSESGGEIFLLTGEKLYSISLDD